MLEVDFKAMYERLRDKEDSHGMTSKEIKEETGWSEKRVMVFVRKAVKAGICRVEKKSVLSIDSRTVRVPAYVFK